MISLRTYFKFLSRNKFYTVVTILGFAISLMFVFLITVYTIQELSVDKFQEKGDRLYLMTHEQGMGNAYRLVDKIKDRYPEVEDVIAMATTTAQNSPVKVNEVELVTNSILVEENFFDIFSFPLVEGDKDHVLATKNNAVISETFARKAFPGRNPLGEVIHYNDSVVLTISGIMKNIINSSLPDADVVLRMDNIKYFNWSMDDVNLSNAGSVLIAILAKQGANLKAKESDFTTYFKEFYWPYQMGSREKVIFIPWKEVYFTKMEGYSMLKQGDKSFVIIFITVGIIILLFALFNYLNLTIAQTGLRAREMATRRLLGADTQEPFFRFIFESVLLTFVSLFIGIFFACLVLPFAEDLLQTKLYLNNFLTLSNGIFLLLFSILMGVVAGLLPGIYISQAKPLDVVKGSFKVKMKMEFSKVFIIIQNTITIILITSALIMYKQVKHLIEAPLGYNYKNILYLNSGSFNDKSDMINFGDELSQCPNVKRVGYSQGIPFQGGNNSTFQYNDRVISSWRIQGDSAFFNMMGFEVLLENNLGYDHQNYLNEQAYKEFELSDDALSIPEFNWHLAGKIKDFKIGNSLGKVAPMVLIKKSHHYYYPWNILIEIQGDEAEAYNAVKKIYEKSHNLSFEAEYLEDMIEKSFANQKRLLQIIIVFCGVAILISILGLIAISTYFIQQRIREIAMKKILGSTDTKILKQLVFSFLTYVLIAFIIAIPITWYIMQEWLSQYAYRISLNPLYFIIGGLFCFLISALAVFYQSYRASIANPVDILKNE